MYIYLFILFYVCICGMHAQTYGLFKLVRILKTTKKKEKMKKVQESANFNLNLNIKRYYDNFRGKKEKKN